MSVPGMTWELGVPKDPAPAPSSPSLSTIQAEVDRISHKVDVCLAEILSIKNFEAKHKEVEHGTFFQPPPPLIEEEQTSKGRTCGTFFHSDRNQPRGSLDSDASLVSQKARVIRLRASYQSSESWGDGGGRIAVRAGPVDLENAWKEQAKKMYEGVDEVDYVQPVMRLVHRTRLEHVWEFLEDPDSGRFSWWTWNFLKVGGECDDVFFRFRCRQSTSQDEKKPFYQNPAPSQVLVVVSMLMSYIQTTELPIIDPMACAVWETVVDSIFFLEMLARVISSPSKKAQVERFHPGEENFS